MKITKDYLKQIIKEEIKGALGQAMQNRPYVHPLGDLPSGREQQPSALAAIQFRQDFPLYSRVVKRTDLKDIIKTDADVDFAFQDLRLDANDPKDIEKFNTMPERTIRSELWDAQSDRDYNSYGSFPRERERRFMK